MPSTMTMELPADVLESARMSVPDLKLELAISLFSLGRLSMGKAAELAGLPVGTFQLQLGARKLGSHYGTEEALEDARALSRVRVA
jgi:predicted HTH domain antitoxin